MCTLVTIPNTYPLNCPSNLHRTSFDLTSSQEVGQLYQVMFIRHLETVAPLRPLNLNYNSVKLTINFKMA